MDTSCLGGTKRFGATQTHTRNGEGVGIVTSRTVAARIARPGGTEIFDHLATVQKYRATLTPEPKPVPGGTWRGGMLWQLGSSHYVAVLLPPCGRSFTQMHEYLGEHFDDRWRIVSHETFGDIEAVHLMPPWVAE